MQPPHTICAMVTPQVLMLVRCEGVRDRVQVSRREFSHTYTLRLCYSKISILYHKKNDQLCELNHGINILLLSSHLLVSRV